MFLKVRIRQYDAHQTESIKRWLIAHKLAQNVTVEQRYIEGDLVNPEQMSNGMTATANTMFLRDVKRLNAEFNIEAEVVVA